MNSIEFAMQYEDEQYLIIIDPFVKAEGAGDIFRYSYSDDENDWVEYRVQVFFYSQNVIYYKKISELSDPIKKAVAEEIEMYLKFSLIANPYFDELMIFFGTEVFTYQEQLKPISCSDCKRSNLYEKRNKGNKSDYINQLVNLIANDKNPMWPFKENLLIQFSVSNSQSKLDRIDLDNLAKTIFDTFKGVVYENDNQIISFAGHKNSVNNVKGFMIAIKRLSTLEKPSLQDYLYSTKLNEWQKEHEAKRIQGKETRFRIYRSINNKK